MNYYKTNAVYERLALQKNSPFIWVSGNAWCLIYGDEHSVPLACVLAQGTSWVPQPKMLKLAQRISIKCEIPFVKVEFDESVTEIEVVKVAINDLPQKTVSLQELKLMFAELGLPVQKGGTKKLINDASSSAFHKWQRQNLGAITVSDLDLFRTKTSFHHAEFIELKRSYIDVESWRPFRADFPNFLLMNSVARRCGVALTIAYNVRHKNPLNDDPSVISLFGFSEHGSIIQKCRVSFEAFVAGSYMEN